MILKLNNNLFFLFLFLLIGEWIQGDKNIALKHGEGKITFADEGFYEGFKK